MKPARRVFTQPRILALGVLVASALAFLHHLDRPFDNLDEAIYAEMTREMVRTGNVAVLRWQDEPILNRPPVSVWPLAASARVFGVRERPIRAVVALEAAGGVALLFLLATELYGLGTGLCAAAFLATADRYSFYARYLESDPLMVTLIIASIYCWIRGRERPRWILCWGVLLGFGFLTKQIVGAFGLVMPLIDGLVRRPLPWPKVRRALAVAAAPAFAWLLLVLVRHGRAALDGLFLRYVLVRSVRQLHSHTTPFFYLEIVVLDQVPYCARFYGDRHTTTLLFEEAVWREYAYAYPGPLLQGRDVRGLLERFPRWYLIVHRTDLRHVPPLPGVREAAAGTEYVLLTNTPL